MAATELLERNIVVHWRPAASAHVIGADGIHFLRHTRAAASAEKPDILRDDLGNVAFVAGLIIVGSSANAALDKNLTPLGEVLSAALALLAPDDDVVPLGALLAAASGVLPDFRSGDGKTRHGAAIIGEPNFGIFAEIADEDDFIDGHIFLSEAVGFCSQGKGAANLAPVYRGVNH